MNLKKLLTLSAAVLLVGTTAVGCGNNSSSEAPDTTGETLTAAAEYVWQMYRNTDGAEVTASFDIVNKVSVGTEMVAVTWSLEATGATAAFSLTKKNENFSTVNVGYYDGAVTEASTVKLVPTFTLGDKTITLADVYADEEAKHAIDFTTPVLTLHSHADWDKNDGALLNIKGTVVDIISKDSGSSSAGSIYMVDEAGNGYYVYKPTAPSKAAKTGDVIIVTGKRSDYSGQEEFGSGASYAVVSSGNQAAINFADGTADWEKAASNKSNDEKGLLATYQNVPVKLEGCTPTRVSGKYYYFTVGSGKAEYNIYDNNYFLNADQIAAWKATFEEALREGYTLTIEGIATVYSNAYQVYPSTLKSHVVTKEAALSVEEKHALVASTLLGAVKSSYKEATTITLPTLPTYATVNSVTVTAPSAGATAAVVDGKIVVTPTEVETTNTVKVNVTIGEVTKDVELTIVSEAKIDPALFLTGEVKYANATVGTNSVVKAKNSEGVEVDVTVLATGVEESQGDWKIGAGDTILVTAPEGYVIDKVEVDSNGTYNTLDFFANADKTGQFDDNTLSDSSDVYSNEYRTANDGRTLTTIPVNGKTFLIANTSASYNVYSHWFKVTLKAAPEGSDTPDTPVAKKLELTPENFLADSKDAYVSAATTATIDGIELEFLQMANYASDGLRMRATKGDCYLLNKTAFESGIKSVSFSILDSKNTYSNTNYMKFEFSSSADFSNAETIVLDTTQGTYDYTITPTVETHKYVRITYLCTAGTCYMDSIAFNY